MKKKEESLELDHEVLRDISIDSFNLVDSIMSKFYNDNQWNMLLYEDRFRIWTEPYNKITKQEWRIVFDTIVSTEKVYQGKNEEELSEEELCLMDTGMAKLFEAVKKGNLEAAKYILSTMAKDRGYGE